MAAGDVTVFNVALKTMLTGGWEAADDIRIALISNTPLQTDATPTLADNTEVAAGGNYVAVTAIAGELLDSWDNCVIQVSNVVTFDDTGATVVWLQNAGNPTDARYGLIVNGDQTGAALLFLDLGAIVDMTAGDLTITWGAGIFTITN